MVLKTGNNSCDESHASLVQPMDVSGLRGNAEGLQEIRRRIRDRLTGLRESFPQIPSDSKKLELVVNRLLGVVQEAVKQPVVTMPMLSRHLRELHIKGLGKANQLWPQLFAISPVSETAALRIDVAQAPRSELSESLRKLLSDYFEQRPEKLEWTIAAILAWRPASMCDLHRLIKKTDPSFLDLHSFQKRHVGSFLFDETSADNPPAARSPDWAVLWEYEGQTGYGGAYPLDVRNFLVSFLSGVKVLDPGATILDIGTGNHAATLLARKISSDFELYGIDVAHLPIPPKETQIRALRMSADQLGFSDQQFMAVISVNGIEYADTDRALPEMHRVMRPGAPGALVLHRPDSLIVAGSRSFLDFIEGVPLMETLALSWLYLDKGSELVRRELARKLAELKQVEVRYDFARYYRAVIDGIPEAVRLRGVSLERAHQLIRRFEKDLRWRYQRDQFMVSQMSRIPADRDSLSKWLNYHGFVVDAISELFDDNARNSAPLGWAVQLHKPIGGDANRLPH